MMLAYDIAVVLRKAQTPLTGDEIRVRIAEEKRYGIFRKLLLFCGVGHLNTILRHLEHSGLIKHNIVLNPHPRRDLYSLTDGGRTYFNLN
jgi:DNA-binding PadR family transcriptional regulator